MSNPLDHLYNQASNHNFIHTITDGILTETLDHIEEAYYARGVSDYVTKWSGDQMIQVLNLVFQKTDAGHPDTSLFTMDLPPQPLKQDALARHSVPLRIRKPEPTPQTTAEQKTHTTRKSRKSRLSKPQSPRTPSNKSKSKLSSSAATKAKAKRKTSDSKTAKNSSKSTPAKRTAEEDRQEELKQLEKLKFSLRGKDYTYDHNGEVIVINQLKAHKLPSQHLSLNVQVGEHSDEDDGSAVAHSARGSSRKPPRKSAQRKKRRASHQNNDEDEIHNLTVSQPMVDKLLPARGVTFKDGKKVLRGDPVVENPTETLRSRRHKDTGGFGMHSSLQPLDSILRPSGGTKKNRSVKNIIDQIESYDESGAPSEQAAQDTASTNSATSTNGHIQHQELDPENFEPAPPQQPARLAPKRTRKVRATPGHLSYTTRQRKNVPTKQRQRLAPPLYPASRGHGAMHSYLSQENPYANSMYQSFTQQEPPLEDDLDGTIYSHVDDEEQQEDGGTR